MKFLFGIVSTALLTLSGSNVQESHPAIAYISKVVKEVERRDSTTADWIKALPTSELTIGCELRTGEGSSVLIQFKDGSKVAVRSQSTIRILGDVSHGKIQNPGMFIEQGRAIFNLKEQKTGGFRFTSPVSVTSIRKGEGGFSFDPSTGQSDLTVGSGPVEFSSTRTDCKVTVQSGHTAVIDSTGCRSH
jgi:hypothetical protein